jgi:hypothetical protein
MIKSANGLISHRPEIKMNQKFIVIDGKTYKSVEEMPEDVHKKYESAMQALDKNQNGVPDMLENTNLFADKNQLGMANIFEDLTSFQGSTSHMISTTKITINGQVYDSLDQLPPDIRAKYEQALGAMDANKNGIPDFVEGMLSSAIQTNNIATDFGTASPRPASPNSIPVSSTIEPDSSRSWLLVLTGILLIGLCLVVAAVGVWYFFLR